jgi:4-azaleucine resistance transporter AzlC
MAFRAGVFWQGVRDTTPMLVGAAPFGVIFGALAVSAGLSAWGALALSGVVFAGSSQFVAVSLMAAGAALPVIWLTTLVVNLRHALYSAALLPHAQGLSARWRWCLAFWLTDETFAVVEHRLRTQGMGADGQWFWLGSSLAMYLNWLGWTLVGVVLGQNIPGLESWGLDFAMAATFTSVQPSQFRYMASDEPSQNHCPSAPMPCVRKRCSTTAKVSSVSQKARHQRQRADKPCACGSKAALYRAWRKFTTKVVSQITGSAAPAAIKLTATNCEEPANTTPDKASAPQADSPALTASAPKITPNGAAPTSIGVVSRTPCQNTPARKAMFAPCAKPGRHLAAIR